MHASASSPRPHITGHLMVNRTIVTHHAQVGDCEIVKRCDRAVRWSESGMGHELQWCQQRQQRAVHETWG